MSARLKWLAWQMEFVRRNFADSRTQDIADALGVTYSQVVRLAARLGLHKSEAFFASPASGRTTDDRGAGSRFKPGLVPWNKGVKGSTGLHENCRRTQFQKGRPAQESRNYAPIGSHRVSKDGYLERKVTDDHPVPARRWTAVHRLVWEAAHGPIPAGHIVRFKAGMKTTVLEEVTPDRLECITRGEHAKRNHPRSHSPELARLVQIKGAITRQVNRISREAQERA